MTLVTTDLSRAARPAPRRPVLRGARKNDGFVSYMAVLTGMLALFFAVSLSELPAPRANLTAVAEARVAPPPQIVAWDVQVMAYGTRTPAP